MPQDLRSHPLDRTAIRFPRDRKRRGDVVPNVTFTPLKRYTASDGYTISSSELCPKASPTFCLPQPPKALRNIAALPTPKLRTVPLYTVADRVSSSHASVGLKCDESSEQGGKQAPKGGTKCKPSCMCNCSVIFTCVCTVNMCLLYSLKVCPSAVFRM